MSRPARAVLDAAMSEREFMATVIEYARLRGWRAYHTHDSRRSEPGFPDLVFLRSGRLVFAELKTEKGRVTAAQQEWLDEFDVAALLNERVVVFVWRPSDWPQIEEALR